MMLRPTKLLRTLLPTLLLSIGAGILVAPTVAMAECEGSSESLCTSQSSCSWVGSDTESDGATVNSFCRNSPNVQRSSNSFGWWKSKHDRHDRHDKYDKHDKHEKYDKHDKNKKSAKDLKHKKANTFDGKSKHTSNVKKTSVMKDGKKTSSKASKVSNSSQSFKSSKSFKSNAKKSTKARSSAKKKARKKKSKKSHSKKRK